MRQYCRQGTTVSDFHNGDKLIEAWPIEDSGNGNEMASIFMIRHDYFFIQEDERFMSEKRHLGFKLEQYRAGCFVSGYVR